MSDFKANALNSISAGLRPRPRWGAYSAPPDPLAGFEGPTSKGGGGKRGGEGMGQRRREGRGGLSGNVAEEAFCLTSAPESRVNAKLNRHQQSVPRKHVTL